MAQCSICGKKLSFIGGITLTALNGEVCPQCMDNIKAVRNLSAGSPDTSAPIAYFSAIRSHNLSEKASDFISALIEDHHSKQEFLSDDELRSREEEKLISSLILTTGFNFEGYTITEYCGLYSGEHVLGTGFASEFAAGVSDMFGTASTTFSSKLSSAKNSALRQLSLSAAQNGCNGIIGISYSFITLAGNMIGVSVNGTGVKLTKTQINL